MAAEKPASSVTIDDVARLAKVSIATVSRTINRPESVSSVLKGRVLEAIRKTGFIPNAGARLLMTNRSGAIGVVMPTLSNTIFAQSLAGFQHRAAIESFQVIGAFSEFDSARESAQILNLVKSGVEAVALTGAGQEPWILRLLQQRKLPYIHVVCCEAPLGGQTIGFDNAKAMRVVVSHLLERGHKHMGVLISKTEGNDRASARLHGAREAIQLAGLQLPLNRIIDTRNQISAIRASFKELLKNAPEITAVICGNDLLAQGALIEAQHNNIRVPIDLSITGFDDFEMSTHTLPPITTVRTSAYQMWGRAAEHLLSQLNSNKSLPRHTLTDVELIIRESTGAPRISRLKLT